MDFANVNSPIYLILVLKLSPTYTVSPNKVFSIPQNQCYPGTSCIAQKCADSCIHLLFNFLQLIQIRKNNLNLETQKKKNCWLIPFLSKPLKLDKKCLENVELIRVWIHSPLGTRLYSKEKFSFKYFWKQSSKAY